MSLSQFAKFTRSVAFHLHISYDAITELLRLEKFARQGDYQIRTDSRRLVRALQHRGLIEASKKPGRDGNWQLTEAGCLLCPLLRHAGFSHTGSTNGQPAATPKVPNQFAEFTRSGAFVLTMSKEAISALLNVEVCDVHKGRGVQITHRRPIWSLQQRGLIDPATNYDCVGNWQLSTAGELLCPLLQVAGFKSGFRRVKVSRGKYGVEPVACGLE